MIPLTRARAAVLVLGPALLAGCAAGHQFSLAMTNPGEPKTVLVVGDGDPGASAASSPTAMGAAVAVVPPGLLAQGLQATAAAPARVPAEPSAVQVSRPGAVVGVAAGGSGLAATASLPATSTAAAVGGGATVLEVSNPLTGAGVAAGPGTGVQLAVTAPAVTALAGGAVASSAAAVQATLSGVTSAVSLAPPTPVSSTPVATALKALTGGLTKKPKHG